jgi:hypothetical protein
MNMRTLSWTLGVLTCLVLVPATARAQSAIGGVVRDPSGAVLPGVTVEAASPALIEKVRSVVSDDRGVYLIVDLRPGTYTITFTLTGFSPFKREGLELPSNFTATVNADLKVGALEETVTVSGASPVVDVQSTAVEQVLNRDVLDAVPTGRTAQTAAALVPGVVMATPDVAGSNGMNQNASAAHGFTDGTVLMDGIQLQGMCGNGTTQSYSNVQNYEEIVIQNNGAGADVSGGGVRQNIIPRKGGNAFHGSGAAAYASGNWENSPLTASLVARGLTAGNSFKNIYDAETGMGGKILKDKVWWFGGTRRNAVNLLIADTFNPDGSQGQSPQSVMNASMRVTTQLTPRNQLNVFYDRVWKEQSAIMSAGYDPRAAEDTHPSPLYDQGQVKWTSTLTNKLLLEVGFNHYQPNRTNTYEPTCACYNQPYNSPGWFNYVTHRDTSLGTITGAYPFGFTTQDTTRHYYDANASYVTGSHNLKVGVQDQHGIEKYDVAKNGDLELNYQNGVPTSAYIFNTPLNYTNYMDHDWGVYGQDTWTARRITLNLGLRWEDFKDHIPPEALGPGRFVGARSYNGDTFQTWKGLNPRLGAVYDLFGNGKTAVKFSANKYETNVTDTLTNGYNPLASQTATVTWKDLNGDGIAQDNELTLVQLPANFGILPPGCSVIANPGATPCGTAWVDPNRKRGYAWTYNIGVQHELRPGISVNANWFHTTFADLPITYNSAQTASEYTPVSIVSPLNGSVITMYNVSAAARSQVLNLNTNDPNARRWNNALEFSSSARLGHGAQVFGGVTMDRTINVACDDPTNPNNLLYCDQSKSGIPWLVNMKLAGSMRLPWGLSLGAAFQSYKYRLGGTAIGNATANYGTQWLITPTTRYAANCPGPCTPGALVDPGMTVANLSVPLLAPGTESTDRVQQLDINLGKWITVGNLRLQPEISLFNALNNLAVYAFRTQNYLTSSYFQPSTTLPPRILRLGVQFKW